MFDIENYYAQKKKKNITSEAYHFLQAVSIRYYNIKKFLETHKKFWLNIKETNR